MEIKDITDFLNQLYVFIAIPSNLIIVALISLDLLIRLTNLLKEQYIPIVLLVVSEISAVCLIKPLAQALPQGIVYTALAIVAYNNVIRPILNKLGNNTPSPTPVTPAK